MAMATASARLEAQSFWKMTLMWSSRACVMPSEMPNEVRTRTLAAEAPARDTFGQAVACPLPGKGLVRLPVPSSGYLEIAY